MDYLPQLLDFAVKHNASDVHLKADCPPVVRIARELYDVEMERLSEEVFEEMLKKLVPPHLVKIFEREHEADFSYLQPNVGRFRVNAFQQRGRMCLAMRYVKAKIPSFEDINMPVENMKKIAHIPRGIVLLVGTTGCGKSTTLAAMIEYINQTMRRHIVTAEDPIEYVFEDNKAVIEQREIGLDTDTFASALKRVLRQDPDIIMIGEMRDGESFMAALAAADTGHLVLSSLHSSSSSASIGRILDFFPHEERDQIRMQLATCLQAVVSQRLVPAIAGGVVPAVEIMLNSPTVRKMLEENRLEKLHAAIETGTDEGMQTFNQAIYKLIKSRTITEKDGLEKASNRQALEMNLKGIFLDEARHIIG